MGCIVVLQLLQSGDIFQLVLSQRYERRTFANPFEVYRALRVVNPSPYMVYMQCRGCIIVSSSPEILCRCVLCCMLSCKLCATLSRVQTEGYLLEPAPLLYILYDQISSSHSIIMHV